MDEASFKDRTKRFALRVIRLVEALPETKTARVIGNQLLRCGTSVGANYRAVCRARSRKDMIAKLGIVLEEADESLYWMDLLAEAGLMETRRLADLIKEGGELVAMTVASIKTLRSGRPRSGKSEI
ncbi:MAG: hypothetical protein BIFFINMI_01199 [Phycisphaerae bacterium]|nr:hypothetical protein [Phycisphaerae bacterium]